MRYIFLVALREYAENAKTKGFWIGLLLFPIMIMIGIQVPGFLEERATPVRHFVLIDESGEFSEVIDRQLVRFHTQRKKDAYGEYLRKNGTEETKQAFDKENLEELPPDFQKLIQEVNDFDPAVLDALSTEQGWNLFVESSKKNLKPDAPEFEEPRLRFKRVELPFAADGGNAEETLDERLKPYLLGNEKITVDDEEKELFAAIIIPENAREFISRPSLVPDQRQFQVNRDGVRYWSTNLTDTDLRNEIEGAINELVRSWEYESNSIDKDIVERVRKTHMPFSALDPKKEEGKEEVSMADTIKQWAPLGFVYLLWVAIFTVAQMLLYNTIEEKSNRIIEVLMSSVTAWELMMGKLVGIAGVGLTMTLTWVVSMLGILNWHAGQESEIAKVLLEVVMDSGLLPAFLAYFAFGYLMYAAVFLSIGSICNTLKEAQNFMGPVMLIMMVPLITMMFIPKDPHGTLATVLSWVPFYTPFVMMNRAAADPPMFDIVGTGVLLVVSTMAVMWLSQKIFRTGILRTGQPPKLLELVKWIRQK